MEHGADINKENNEFGTPIFIACLNGHEDIVKYLVDHDANINKVTIDGSTALKAACFNDNLNLAKYLVHEHGFDINKEDIYGWTPLLISCHEGHINIVKYLIEYGVYLNKERNNDWILLLYACRMSKKKKTQRYSKIFNR